MGGVSVEEREGIVSCVPALLRCCRLDGEVLPVLFSPSLLVLRGGGKERGYVWVVLVCCV